MAEKILQKLKPQALDAEQAVLGAILIDTGSEIPALEGLKPESFYDERHKKIFEAILDLSKSHKPIDIVSVKNQLIKNGDLEFIGGASYLAYLSSNVASGSHIDFHTKLVAEAFIKRRLIDIANRIQEKSYDPSSDVEDLIEFSEKQIFDIALDNISKAAKPIDTVIKETKNYLEELSKRETSFSGVPSGFTELDRMTSGWQPSDLIIVAARPSMGKTAFVLSMTRNMAVDHNVPVAFFSLEMSAQQLATRLIISETEIDSQKIKTGKLSIEDWMKIEEKTNKLAAAPIYIDDTAGISLTELRAKCRSLKIQHDIQIVIIDYLQLMTGSTDTRTNREQEVSQISRGLKALAKELNIPVIALSQLNRAVESRNNKRPQMSDLRESGAIEQDADIVILIHRPEKFGLEPIDQNGNHIEGLAEIIIEKYRNGPTGIVDLQFIDSKAKFQDIQSSLAFEDEQIFESKINTQDDEDPFADKDFFE